MAQPATARTPHRQRLLRAGDRLFYERGYHGTSVDAVLAEAGAPKGSFYHHFSSKETFGFAVLQRYAESRQRLLTRWLEREDLDVVARVTGYHQDLVERFDESGWERACLAGKLSNEIAWSSEPFREQLTAVFGASKEAFRVALEYGQQSGDVRADLPADALAEAVQMIVQGGFVAALALRDRSSLDQLSDAIGALLRGDGAHVERASGVAIDVPKDPSPAAGGAPADASTRRSHRETLLREGLHQIFMNGCHGTTVDRLLAASGVPKGSFYHHFGTRPAFFGAVLERYGAFHRGRLDSWRRREELTTAEQVGGYYRDLVAIFIRSGYLNSDLSGKVATEFAATSDPLREQVAANMRDFLGLLEDLLKNGQARGEVRTDQPARQVAVAVHALIVGSFLIAQSHRDADALKSVADVMAYVVAGP